jgi:hypothetical protein
MQRKAMHSLSRAVHRNSRRGQSAENENADRPHWEEELPYYLYFETNSF